MHRVDYVRQMPGQTTHLTHSGHFWRHLSIDWPLLLLLLALTLFGLWVLYSATGQDYAMVYRQTRLLLMAYAVMLLVAHVQVETIKRLAPWAYGVAMVLLIAVAIAGVGAKGAQRWLSIAGVRFQPSELMKLVVPMTVAGYLAHQVLPPRLRLIAISLLLILLPSLLIAKQPDLGTAILVVAAGLFVLFFSGLGWRFIFGAIGLLVAAAYPLWHFFLQDYQKQRILTLFNPESDKLGTGWNIIQSKTAIGSGGWAGKGWLNGTQSQLDFLPESHTDFIIAVLAEEGGLRSILLLLILYLLIISRGLWIAAHAQHSFGRLLAGSITLTFFVYVFVNMAMVSGLLPVVGIPLPLFSYGGTSLITLMASFGLLMAIGTEKRVVGQ